MLEVCKRGPNSWKLPSKTGSGAQAEEVQLSIKGYMQMIDVHIYLSIYLSLYKCKYIASRGFCQILVGGRLITKTKI